MVKNIFSKTPTTTGATSAQEEPMIVNMLNWSCLIAPTANALLNRESTAQHNLYLHTTTPRPPLKPTKISKEPQKMPQNDIPIINDRSAELEF